MILETRGAVMDVHPGLMIGIGTCRLDVLR